MTVLNASGPSPSDIGPAPASSVLFTVHALPEATLLAGLGDLVRQCAEVTAVMLAHLGEVDARRLHLALGYGSLFAYCTEALGLSESAAYKRIQVARLGRRLPAVLDAVAGGRVHLSGLCVLAPSLDPSNCEAVLAEASGRSKRDIEALAAQLRPEPVAVPNAPQPAPGQADLDLFARPAEPGPAATPPGGAARPAADALPVHSTPATLARGPATPPGPARRLSFLATPRLLERLERARALLGHALPGADTADVIERALDLLIAKAEKARFGVGARPRPPRPAQGPAAGATEGPSDAPAAAAAAAVAVATLATPAGSEPPVPQGTASAAPRSCEPSPRNTATAASPSSSGVATSRGPRPRRALPRDLRRTVYLRDGGQCTFVAPDGRRCDSTHRLELHHRVNHSTLGPDTVYNITLHCRAHNDLLARRDFGDAVIDARIEARRRHRPASGAPEASAAAGRPGAAATSPSD